MNNDHATNARSALVAYGSETGNALDFAEEVGRALERLHFDTLVTGLNSVELSSFSSFTFIVFIASTTGQGDLPTNARTFWRSLLRKKLPPTFLQDVEFTSFGLGDSSYPRFNWAIRKIHKRVLQLGGLEVHPRGEADEQHDEGNDATFIPWMTELCQNIQTRFPLPQGLEPIADDVLLPPKWLLATKDDTGNLEPRMNGLPHDNNAMTVELRQNERITPLSHWQDVRHFKFSCDTAINYEPGDVLTIHPKNNEEDVGQMIDLMGWNDVARQEVSFVRKNGLGKAAGALPIELLSNYFKDFRTLLLEHLDIAAIPRRSFFAKISNFTDDEFQKERLIEFTKPEYIDELYDYTTRPRRSILEVLQEFDTVKIPWQWAANVVPELRGRQFSIASGGKLKKDASGMAAFELLVAIVKYKTVIKKMREGVCTKYLAGLEAGAQLDVTLSKGGLGIDKSHATRPIVMVGPGTGVAPIRSLIWERLRYLEDGQDGLSTHRDRLPEIGKNLLIYGCRNASADYFFRDEWESIQAQIPLEVCPAFSRDQRTKIYVQDILRQRKDEVFNLLHDKNGIVFVCGSSGKMPTAVRTALADVFRDCGLSQNDAESYLSKMEKEGRYKQETWS